MTNRNHRLFGLGVGLLIIFGAFGLAQAGEYSSLQDRAQVLRSAELVTRDVYPNADEVIVDDYILAKYETDGTAVELDETYTKVLTEKGRRENQTQSYHFTIPYDELEVRLIEIIKPDGKTVPIDVAGQSKVMIDPSQMGSNIYNPNSKILEVGVAGLEVGDILHTYIERRSVKTRMPDQWSDYQVFEYYNPIKHVTYEVLAPKEMPLQSIALKDEVQGTASFDKGEKEGRISYKWEFSNVPRIFPEPDMPAFYTVVQRLLVSTIPDWKVVSSWYWNLSESHFTPDEDMKAKVAELTDGLTDRMEKIRAIFKFVSQDIRYLGITVEKEAPGYEPHDATMTFANRHGVCRDKAALLVAMLRVAGFDAFPVLIHSGPKKDDEVPQPYFNHAISCVRDADGNYILMDSTDESTKKLLPGYLNDCSYLVATPEGETLKVSPIVPADENMLFIKTQAKVDSKGRYEANSEIEFDGINDNAYRGYFARITPEQRRELFEGVVKGVLPGAKLASFEIEPENMLDTNTKIKVKLSYAADDVLVTDNDKAMMPVYAIGSRLGMVNFVLGKTGLKERRFPLETSYACGVKEELELKIDPEIGQVESLPTYKVIDDESLLVKRDFAIEGDVLKGESVFKIKIVRFDPQQYLTLKEHLKDIEYDGRKMMILDSQGYSASLSKADAEILDDVFEYYVESENSWKVRAKVKKKILTYKGKKDNSELKFSFNPAWEDFKLIKATVETNGVVKEISEQEQNLMDAPWVGSAPRYPAGKVMVASLPGVEIGSVIEYEYERVLKDRPFFEMLEYMRVFDPINKKVVRLDVPEGMELFILVDENGVSVDDEKDAGVIASTVKTGNGRVVYEWSVEKQSGMKIERSLPPLYSFVPVVKVSSGQWSDYCKSIRSRIQDAVRGQKEANAKSKEIVKGLWAAQDKIEAIRDYVAKNIRLAGPGVGALPFSSISAADVTLKDGYGNTLDRAILLYSMIRAAGVNCDFVLASGESRITELEEFRVRYPDMATFSQALVRVHTQGKDVYLNNTTQYSKIGANPADRFIGLGLKNCKPLRIAVGKDLRTKVETNFKIKLSDSGDAQIVYEQEQFGGHFESNNKAFSEMRPEELRRKYQEILAGLSQSAQAESELEFDYDNYPGSLNFTAKIKRFAVIDGDYMYFKLPSSGFELFFGLRADVRENSLLYARYNNYICNMDIELPPSYQKPLLVPEEAEMIVPQGRSVVKLVTKQTGPHSIRISYIVDLKPQIIPAADYQKIIDIVAWLTHDKIRAFLLEKGEAAFEIEEPQQDDWVEEGFPFFNIEKLFDVFRDTAE